ncbi:MAG TPA: polyphosphate kinase 2 family protein [Nitrospirales bacterium]|nr:polyphosphate kinase 2 family protein [Nitrospirales bacterium]
MSRHRVKPGETVDLAAIDPDDTGDYDGAAGKAKAKAKTDALIERLEFLQDRLYANAGPSLLIVLQGMDTSGKDGTIKHVMSGANPMGCHVRSFKLPTPQERAHDFLWRVHHEAPAAGYIGIFNRSHYEDVLVTRVHEQINKREAERRFAQIRDFERLLNEHGTAIVKFFLHISKDEQRDRLEERVKDKEKRWKFSPNDLAERKLWAKYQAMYEAAIAATSTKDAPWFIVPANRKWYRNLVVAETIVETLEALKLRTPPASPDIDFKTLKIS